MFKPSFVHAYTRKHWRMGQIFIPIWIGIVALGTAAAGLDAALHLGWGYDWGDALFGVGMIAFGLLFWILWNAMFRLLSWLNATFYGPDVGQDAENKR